MNRGGGRRLGALWNVLGSFPAPVPPPPSSDPKDSKEREMSEGKGIQEVRKKDVRKSVKERKYGKCGTGVCDCPQDKITLRSHTHFHPFFLVSSFFLGFLNFSIPAFLRFTPSFFSHVLPSFLFSPLSQSFLQFFFHADKPRAIISVGAHVLTRMLIFGCLPQIFLQDSGHIFGVPFVYFTLFIEVRE